MKTPKIKMGLVAILAMVMFLAGVSTIYATTPSLQSRLLNFISSSDKEVQSDLNGATSLCEKDPVKYGYLCDSTIEKPKTAEEKSKELVAQKLASERNAKISKLTSDQKIEYVKLTTQTNMHYFRRVAQLLGDLSMNQPRITLEQAKNIALDSNIDRVIEKLNDIHGKPDLETGSGLTIFEYWLDDTGTEKITILKEQNQVYLVKDKHATLLSKY